MYMLHLHRLTAAAIGPEGFEHDMRDRIGVLFETLSLAAQHKSSLTSCFFTEQLHICHAHLEDCSSKVAL